MISNYSVPKRGIYYCCRLISRQLDVLDKEESYDQLKPVYSVWILINNIPKKLRNSIYSVDLAGKFYNKDLDSSARAIKLNKEVDLIHLRLVYLSEDFDIKEEQSDLVKYLQSVFANKVCDVNCNPYHEYSKMIEREVDAMMSVADVLEARAERRGKIKGERIGELRGEQKGERRGKQKGERRGKQRGRVEVLLQFGKTDAEIIQYLTANLNDPLTEEEAIEILESCRKENH